MKIVNWITSWTTRNLKWLIPFCLIMPFVLWWWNSNLDQIGYWLWLALHGQKAADLELAAYWTAVTLLAVAIFSMALLDVKAWFARNGKGDE